MNKKYLYSIIQSNLRQLLISLMNITFPLLVILKEGKSAWGEFLEIYLYILLMTAIILWGNKNYLLRKFSQNPQEIIFEFSSSMGTRFYILILLSIVGFFLFPFSITYFLIICNFGLYLSLSTEILVIYQKDFIKSLFIEFICFFFLIITICFYPIQLKVLDIVMIFSLYQIVKGIIYIVHYKAFFKLKYFRFDNAYLIKTLPLFMLGIFGFLGNRIDVYIFQEFSSLSKSTEYHILNNFVIFFMAFSNQILTPFTKHFYRGSKKFYSVLRKKIILTGLVFLSIAIPILNLVMWYLIGLKLSVFSSFLIFIAIFPTYYCCVDIMTFYKKNKDYYILKSQY